MTPPETPAQYLTVRDVARRLNVSERTVRHYCQTGKLRSVHIGALVRIDPADLEAFIRQCRESPRAAG